MGIASSLNPLTGIRSFLPIELGNFNIEGVEESQSPHGDSFFSADEESQSVKEESDMTSQSPHGDSFFSAAAVK